MRQAGSYRLKVVTAEGIQFSFILAGPVTRFLAWVIDVAVIGALVVALNAPLALVGTFSRDAGRAASVLAYFGVSIGYRIFMEWKFSGQTFGKRILRLRVLDAQGLSLDLSQVVIRNLLRFVDSLPAFYMVGGLAGVVSKRAQRLGDLAADTIVVASPQLLEPDLEQLLQGKYNSFVNYPHLVARLRQRATARIARIALMALLRRESLDPLARIDLFKSIADNFRSLVRFPAEATEGISDESYVRNCVDVLYQPRVPSNVSLAFGCDSGVKPDP